MNKYDTEIASKIGARDLITALNGLSVQKAVNDLDLLSHSFVSGVNVTPDHLAKYKEALKGLPSGASLYAIQLARHTILLHTPVDIQSEASTMAFALWEREAALTGARLTA